MITVTLTGTDTATCRDITIKGRGGKSPMNKLARTLISNGADPEAETIVKRGDTVCFDPLPLRWWADHIAQEGDRSSVRFVKYQPMPKELHEASQ